MTNTILHTLSVFLLLLTSSNKNGIQKQDNPFLEIAVIQEIEQYYHKEYSQATRQERIEEDSFVETIYFNKAYKENTYESFVMRIEIPKEKESDLILTGDLNNDNQDDLIVGVITEGVGYGGKIYWVDYFVFLNKENNYHLTTVKSNRELSDCQAGFVTFNKIENNTIKATESCFAKGDSRCCPSVHYEVEVEVVVVKPKTSI